jgi:putative glycosyltransferase (TIGR04372 family)
MIQLVRLSHNIGNKAEELLFYGIRSSRRIVHFRIYILESVASSVILRAVAPWMPPRIRNYLHTYESPLKPSCPHLSDLAYRVSWANYWLLAIIIARGVAHIVDILSCLLIRLRSEKINGLIDYLITSRWNQKILYDFGIPFKGSYRTWSDLFQQAYSCHTDWSPKDHVKHISIDDAGLKITSKAGNSYGLTKLAVLHVRTGYFYSDTSNYRNSDIGHYLRLSEELSRRGWQCVFVGEYDAHDLTLIRDSALAWVDFKNHSADELELINSARLYIGTTSGPIDVAMLLNKSIVCIDMPYLDHFCWRTADSVYAPKYIFSEEEGRFLTPFEIASLPTFGMSTKPLCLDAKQSFRALKYFNLTPEHISMIVQAKLEGTSIQQHQLAYDEYLRSQMLRKYQELRSSSYASSQEYLADRWVARMSINRGVPSEVYSARPDEPWEPFHA